MADDVQEGAIRAGGLGAYRRQAGRSVADE